jgi:hypothetical protein
VTWTRSYQIWFTHICKILLQICVQFLTNMCTISYKYVYNFLQICVQFLTNMCTISYKYV